MKQDHAKNSKHVDKMHISYGISADQLEVDTEHDQGASIQTKGAGSSISLILGL
jgi:hypothetical protein